MWIRQESNASVGFAEVEVNPRGFKGIPANPRQPLPLLHTAAQVIGVEVRKQKEFLNGEAFQRPHRWRPIYVYRVSLFPSPLAAGVRLGRRSSNWGQRLLFCCSFQLDAGASFTIFYIDPVLGSRRQIWYFPVTTGEYPPRHTRSVILLSHCFNQKEHNSSSL